MIDDVLFKFALTRLIERGAVVQSGRGSYAAIENVKHLRDHLQDVVAEINGDEF